MADDHSIVRRGMKHLFGLTQDISVVADVASGKEVLSLLPSGDFDIILLDMTMSGVSGVNLISYIHQHYPKIPILVLSMHNEPQIAKRALNAGAAGYITKDSEPEVLLDAVRKVAQGGRFIESIMAEQMVFADQNTEQTPLHEQLSKREYEILLLVAQGKNLNEIADHISISNKTVSTYKRRLMQKMEISSNADLVRYVMENNLT